MLHQIKSNPLNLTKVVSDEVANAIEEYITDPCRRGEPVTLLEIGAYLAKRFNHDTPSTFKVLAQLAFQHNQLPEYFMKRGREGGVFHK